MGVKKDAQLSKQSQQGHNKEVLDNQLATYGSDYDSFTISSEIHKNSHIRG